MSSETVSPPGQPRTPKEDIAITAALAPDGSKPASTPTPAVIGSTVDLRQRALRERGTRGASQAGARGSRVLTTKVGAGRAEGAHAQEGSDRSGVMSRAHSDFLRGTIVFPVRGGSPPSSLPSSLAHPLFSMR